MALVKVKPTSNGRRALVKLVNPALHKGKPVQGLLEARMACGMGICYSCAIFPRQGGVKLVCHDGPMFDLRDVYA